MLNIIAEQSLTPAQQAAETKAKADKAAAERSTVTDGWQDLYNTGGDKAVADYIKTNYKKGGAGWREADLNHANQVINTPGSTFTSAAKADYDKAYASWDQRTRYNDQTRYGASQQTLKQLQPWEQDYGYKNLSNYDDFNFSGWVDPQIQIDKDNAAKAKADKAAEAQRKAEALAASQKQTQAELTNSVSQKNQSVQNAFYGSNNQINQGANKNREEAVERVQEYQKTNSNQTTSNTQDYQNTSSNKAVNNTEKSSTSSTTSSNNSGYVQQLADNAIGDYNQKWRNNQGSTTNYSNIFTNNIKQDVGNSGNWTTNFGNNNKLNNVRAGNDYSLNLGNINLENN